jgi:hypothetical protein
MRVRARPLDLPLSTPRATAQATLTTAPLVLADGQTDQGIVGMGQAPRPCRSYRHPDGPTHSPTHPEFHEGNGRRHRAARRKADADAADRAEVALFFHLLGAVRVPRRRWASAILAGNQGRWCGRRFFLGARLAVHDRAPPYLPVYQTERTWQHRQRLRLLDQAITAHTDRPQPLIAPRRSPVRARPAPSAETAANRRVP